MKIDEQDIKKKKSSGEIKKKKGKNSGKKDLKEEDIDKKVDIIKEDGTTKADAVGGTKEKDVAIKDTKAVDDKLNIIKEDGKGQLISKFSFGVTKWPKNQRNICKDLCPSG